MAETDPIVIRIEAIDEATKTIQRITGELKGLENVAESGKQATESFNKLTHATNKLGNSLGLAKTETRRFKFEWLSLMFAGMALDRVFGGLARSVFEMFGISESLASMWAIVLLPVIEPLANLLYGLMEIMMDLPEPVKIVLGVFVLLAAAIGFILSAVGQAILGMGGLAIAFPGLWAKLVAGVSGVFSAITGLFSWLWGLISGFVAWVAGALGVSFGAAVAIIVAVIAAITALVFGGIEAWKNNFLGFKDSIIKIWESIKQFIQGFVQFFAGAWNVIAGIFTLNTEKIKAGFAMMGEGVKNIFISVANFVINVINTLVSLVISGLAQVVRAAQFIWNLVPAHAKVDWYGDMMKLGANKNLIPSFQTGGIMPHTGLAMLHAGERIIPANQVSSSYSNQYSPTINLNANVSSSYDVRKLAGELNQYWARDFEKIAKGK